MRKDVLLEVFCDRDAGGRARGCCIRGSAVWNANGTGSSSCYTDMSKVCGLTHFCIEHVHYRLEGLSRDIFREPDGRRKRLPILCTDKLHYDVRRRPRQLRL